MKAPSMTALGTRNSSDKVEHGYTALYDEMFTPYRYSDMQILEIGFARGRGTRTLAEYFNRSMVYCFDIDPDWQHYSNLSDELQSRIRLFQGDQGDANSIHEVLRKIANDPDAHALSPRCRPKGFDIIIDDGSHVPAHQRTSFKMLWPELNSGGVYIIEDFHPYYENNSHHTVSWLFEEVHKINRYGDKRAWVQDYKTKAFVEAGAPHQPLFTDLVSITFSYNQALIRKA